MTQHARLTISFLLCLSLILEQTAFAQAIDLSGYFASNTPAQAALRGDKFRPLHLRYISYDTQSSDFKLLIDKGDFFNSPTPQLPNSLNSSTPKLQEATQELMKYFFIGLALPNDKFWVNLRPDSPENILDPDLEKTDIGRIFLEADLQLKKDTSGFTSPQTPEGRQYWDKLYKRAGELFGTENITIPTITRPWIVPNEIIIREAPDSAYIYKATLKVMLEEDYIRSPGHQVTKSPNQLSKPNNQPLTSNYNFSDPRLKELNEYSTELIRETIIPKLTYEINTAKRYAHLRQVYYSLILAQWFKQKYGRGERDTGNGAEGNPYIKLIDSGNLTSNLQPLTTNQPYSKESYFKQYQRSFKDGEYNISEQARAPQGQMVRTYVSGGLGWQSLSASSSITSPDRQIKFFRIPSYILAATVFISSFFTPQTGAYDVRIEYDDNNVPRSELVFTEDGEDPQTALREIIEEISKAGNMRLSKKEINELIKSVEKDNGGLKRKFAPGEVLDITALPKKALFKAIMNKAKVLAEQKADSSGSQATIYYVKSDILRMLQLNAIANNEEKVIVVDVDNVVLEIKSMLSGQGAYNPDFDFIRGDSVKEPLTEKIERHIRLLLKHEDMHLTYGELIAQGKMGKRLLDMVGLLPGEIRNRVADEILAYLGSGDTRQTLSFMLGLAYDRSAGPLRDIYRQAGIILSRALLGELGYGKYLLFWPGDYSLTLTESPIPGGENRFLFLKHLKGLLDKIPEAAINRAGEDLFRLLLPPGESIGGSRDIAAPQKILQYIKKEIERSSSAVLPNEVLSGDLSPRASSGTTIDKKKAIEDFLSKIDTAYNQEEAEGFVKALLRVLLENLPEGFLKKSNDNITGIKLGSMPQDPYLQGDVGVYSGKEIFISQGALDSWNPLWIADVLLHEFGHPLLNDEFPDIDEQTSADFLANYALEGLNLKLSGRSKEKYGNFKDRLEEKLGGNQGLASKMKSLIRETKDNWYVKLSAEMNLPDDIESASEDAEIQEFFPEFRDLINGYKGQENPISKRGILRNVLALRKMFTTPLRELSNVSRNNIPLHFLEEVEFRYDIFIGAGRFITPENKIPFSLLEIIQKNLKITLSEPEGWSYLSPTQKIAKVISRMRAGKISKDGAVSSIVEEIISLAFIYRSDRMLLKESILGASKDYEMPRSVAVKLEEFVLGGKKEILQGINFKDYTSEEKGIINDIFNRIDKLVGIFSLKEATDTHKEIAASAIAGNNLHAKDETLGGIDLSSLPIRAESIAWSSLSASRIPHPLSRIPDFDLDQELARLQAMVNADIRPSLDRLSQYAVAASSGLAYEEGRGKVIGLFADVLRNEETAERLPATEPIVQDIISILEGNNPAR